MINQSRKAWRQLTGEMIMAIYDMATLMKTGI